MQAEQRPPPRTWHPAAMLILLVAAASLFYRNITFGLPDYLYGDEGAMWVTADQVAQVGHSSYQPYYPPGFVYIYAGQIKFLELITPGTLPREIPVLFVRFTSANLGLVILALLYDIGRRLGSRAGGLLAALFVAVYPEYVLHTHLIVPDIAVTTLGIIALWAAIVAQGRSASWLYVSMLAAILGFLTKYTLVGALAIPFLATLVKFFRQPRKLLQVGGLLLAEATVALGLVHWRLNLVEAVLKVRYDRPEDPTVLAQRATSFDFAGAASGGSQILSSIGIPTLSIAFVLLPVFLTLQRRWTSPTIRKLLVVTGFGAATFAPFALIGTVYLRYFLPTVMSIAILWGLALSSTPSKGLSLIVVPAGLLFLTPQLNDSLTLVERFGRPDTLAQATDWLVEHVPQGARIAADGEANNLYFSRYAGYTGPLVFNITDVAGLSEVSTGELQNQGIEYIVASTAASRDYYSNVAGLGSQDAPEIVAEIDPPGVSRGPKMLILSVPHYQQHTRYLWLGDAIPAGDDTMYPIALRGYDLPRTELQPAFVLEFTLYWMSVLDTTTDYTVDARLVDSRTDELAARHESQPDRGFHPTSQWEGDMQFIPDKHLFVLPDDLQPGNYELEISLYDAETGKRLPVSQVDGTPSGTSFTLGEITISG